MGKNKKNIKASKLKLPIRMRKRRHPDQPLVLDEHGVVRFKQNALVRWLLDFADEQGMGLDHIVRFPYKRSDYEQLMQLIGYSVEGYCELSSVGEKSKDKSWERMCELQYALELEESTSDGAALSSGVCAAAASGVCICMGEGVRREAR